MRRKAQWCVSLGVCLAFGSVLAVFVSHPGQAEQSISQQVLVSAAGTGQSAVPVMDVNPTDFPGLILGPGGSDSVVVAIANLGDAPLTFDMSVTSDNAGGPHVRINGGSDYSSVAPPLAPPELVTIQYDAVGLLNGGVYDWRIEVVSNDPAHDPNQGGLPVSINLQVLINDGTVCLTCGDINQSGAISSADLVALTSYLFAEGPSPADPTCADADDYLLPTMRDLVYLADFLFGGGPAPVCPPANPPCPPMPGGVFQITYDPVFAAGRTTDTLFLNLVNAIGTRGLVVPLQIRVDGAIPAIGNVQVFDNGGWTNPTALVNPAGAPCGSVLLAYIAPSGSVVPGDRQIAAIEISVPASAVGRLISLDIGEAFPPMAEAQNVNYAVAIDDDPALNCWAIELLPISGQVVDCGQSFAASCLTACPAGDEAFSVFLRDPAGLPVVGSQDVWLDFGGCPSVVPCSSEANWPLVFPEAPSAANGRAVFLVNAGGCDDGCMVQVMSSCGPIATVPFKSVDTDGDLFVGPTDYDGSLCNDYDCSGSLKDGDLFTFTSHVSHDCSPDIRTLIRPEITITPDAGVAIGDSVAISVAIRNNTADPVTVDSVLLYLSDFDVGVDFNAIPLQPELVNAALNTGDITVVTTTYILPPPFRALAAAADQPLECVTAEIYTSAAVQPVVSELCERVVRQACTPDTSFGFTYYVPQIPVYYWPFIFMPTGFSAVVNPDVHLQFTVPDSVTADVSIDPPTATLGDSGTVIMLFCEDDNCANEVTERRFRAIYAHQRGDVNDNCAINSADVIYLVNYVFKSGPEPLPYESIGNINCLGDVNSADVIELVNFVFKGGDPLLGDCP